MHRTMTEGNCDLISPFPFEAAGLCEGKTHCRKKIDMSDEFSEDWTVRQIGVTVQRIVMYLFLWKRISIQFIDIRLQQ